MGANIYKLKEDVNFELSISFELEIFSKKSLDIPILNDLVEIFFYKNSRGEGTEQRGNIK